MLGVTRVATDVEIKSAYRKLAMTYHPDRNPNNPEAEDKFKELTEAYAVLADSEKRSLYDRFGHAGVGGSGAPGGFDPTIFQDFGDIFGDIFGFGDAFAQGGRRRSRAQRGADLREDLHLEFEEAVFGTEKQVKVRRQETCDACRGSGSAPGKAPVPCKSCNGRGQVRYQQGFFSIARTCPTCQGAGSVVTDPCPKCKGEGRMLRERVVDDVARRLKVHPETVRRYLRAGQLRGVQFGGKRTGYRVRMSDLELFISGNKQLELPDGEQGKLAA